MLHLFKGHSVQDLVYTHLGSKHKRYIKHTDYNLACDFVWVSNLVSYIKRTTKAEGVQEQGAEVDVLD
jgi:hypothetical protein